MAQAQRYQVELGEGFEKAKAIMTSRIESAVEDDIGGDEQRVQSVDTRWSALTFKHLLLPVWIGAYRFQDKVFQVTVNARTGEVQGERPYSTVKIVLAVLLALAIVFVLVWFNRQRQL